MSSYFKSDVVDKFDRLKLSSSTKKNDITNHTSYPSDENTAIAEPEYRNDQLPNTSPIFKESINPMSESAANSYLTSNHLFKSTNQAQVPESNYTEANSACSYMTSSSANPDYFTSKYLVDNAQCSYMNHYSTSEHPYNSSLNYDSNSFLPPDLQFNDTTLDGYSYAMPNSHETNEREETGESALQLEYLNFNFSSTGIPLKEIVEVLGPEEIRWHYKTEGDKKWTSFIGYDSLRIEWIYREFLQKTTSRGIDSFQYQEQLNESQPDRPVVCGGLYEVDVSVMKAFSIYWKAEEFTIMRGSWFYEGTWLPVEENIAEKIENEHLIKFIGQNSCTVPGKDINHKVIHSLTLHEGHIDWFSPSEIFFSHDATPSRLMRSVSKKLGFQKTGCKLHRGYCLDASAADKPPDITHIVFVIHGIGQKMDTGRIIRNCTSLRENMKLLKEKHFPESEFINQSIEFFPVEWRSSLILDAGIIESITPHKIMGLRQMLNASFMDIMYYNSPQYSEEIVNGLTSELDRLYTMFTTRNPYFEANGGKVSVLAHSLGCVITYDIVTGWSPAPQMSQSFLHALIDLTKNKSYADGESTLYSFQSTLQHVLEQQLVKTSQPRLKFKIENFFCLGSPLAVFLGLRWKRQESASPPYNPNQSFTRLFNIFHPADPVAYRMEPLLCSKFSSIAPVKIQAYTATGKAPYNDVPNESLLTPTPGQIFKDSMNGKPENHPDRNESENVSADQTSPSKSGSSSWNFWNFMKHQKKGMESLPPNKSFDDVPDHLKQRIDFVLREGSMENSYWSALTSHTSYWGNVDIAYFLLSILCPQYVDMQKVPKL